MQTGDLTSNSRPLSVQRYIKLIVSEPLDHSSVVKWFSSVKDFGPSGVIAVAQTVDEHGQPYGVMLVHRETKAGHEYIIPLTRDLMSDEVGEIVSGYAGRQEKLDFDIETNERGINTADQKTITVDQEKHLALCMALAKDKHDDWMKERLNADWRYGPTFSMSAKTHPLLLPWEQLPDRYKVPDLNWPQKLINLLNDQGYAVVPKTDLTKPAGLLHGTL